MRRPPHPLIVLADKTGNYEVALDRFAHHLAIVDSNPSTATVSEMRATLTSNIGSALHFLGELAQAVRTEQSREHPRGVGVLHVHVEDVTQRAVEPIRGEGVDSLCDKHKLAHRVWVGKRALCVQEAELREEGEQRRQCVVGQLGRDSAKQLRL